MTGRKWVFAVVAVILLVMAVGVYSKYDPTASRFFPPCPVKFLTGLSCPGCGLQRAFHALLDGRLADALAFNYFFILSIPYAAALILSATLRLLNRAPRLILIIENRWAALGYLAAYCIWFVVRNVLGI